MEQKSPQQDDGPEAHHDQAGRVKILIGQQAQHAASPFCRGRSPRLPCPDAEQHTGSSPCQYAVRPGPSVDSYKVEYSIPSQDIQVNDFSPPPVFSYLIYKKECPVPEVGLQIEQPSSFFFP